MTEHDSQNAETLAVKVAAAGDIESLKTSGATLMEQIDSGQLEIDGKDGFLN